MFLLSIVKETDSLVELTIQSSTHQAMGRALVDNQGIFYTLTSGKGAVPKGMVEAIDIVADANGRYLVEIHTKCDEEWNRGVRRHHPILYWLNLIKRSRVGKVSLGSFELQVEADRFRQFLKKLAYPV